MIRAHRPHPPPRRCARILRRATASASGEMSAASTRARGNARAQAMAMQPEPVPMSSTPSHSPRLDPRRKTPLDELGDRRARDQHARDRHRTADPQTSSVASGRRPARARGCADRSAPECFSCAGARSAVVTARRARSQRALRARARSMRAASSRALSVPWPKYTPARLQPPCAAARAAPRTVGRELRAL